MDAVINGIPLIAVIIGLVELVKLFGVEGRYVNVVSVFCGVTLGGGHYVLVTGNYDPMTLFVGLVTGIAYGLAASGLWMSYNPAHNAPEHF